MWLLSPPFSSSQVEDAAVVSHTLPCPHFLGAPSHPVWHPKIIQCQILGYLCPCMQLPTLMETEEGKLSKSDALSN